MKLVFIAAQKFLLTDNIFWKMERGFLLENAVDLKVDGEDAILDMELRHGKHGILDLFPEVFYLHFIVLCRRSCSKVQLAILFLV